MDGKVKITHHYWWDNDVYYRRSVNGGPAQMWDGAIWTPVQNTILFQEQKWIGAYLQSA